MNETKVSLNGAVIFFTLSDDSSYGLLEAGFTQIGMSRFIPEKNTAKAALKSSMVKTFGSRRTKIDPLEGKPGYAVTRVKGDMENNVRTLDYDVEFTAEIPTNSHWFPFHDPSTGQVIEPDGADECRKRFWEELQLVPSHKVSRALVNIIEGHLGGVRLRETGGIYWIPQDSMDAWDLLSVVVESAGSNSIYKMVTAIDNDSVRALCDALTRSVESEVASMNNDIMSGDLGKRALDSRREKADELRTKVKSYEKILGMTLDGLSAQCEETDAAAVAACLSTFGS